MQVNSDQLPAFPTDLTARQLRDAVTGYPRRWYHQFRFAGSDGVEVRTPEPQQNTTAIWTALDRLGLPADAAGVRMLDIGCSDGFFSFAMEQRGADVVPIDYRDVESHGFGLVRQIIGSDLRPRTDAVYLLDAESYGTFDVVLLLGVLYHLRHPLLALDRIRSVMRPGGLLFIESHIATRPKRPAAARFYRRDSHGGDFTNYFAPNDAAVEAWLDATEFEQLAMERPLPSRGCYVARAVEDGPAAYFRDLEWSPGTAG